MKAIIIYFEKNFDCCTVEGGIYEDISEKKAIEEIGKSNLYYYIPLVVSGKSYEDRKNDLRNKAIEYQSSFYDFCGFSYGELSIIQNFFETNAKKYGLLNEFRENCII